MYKIKDTKVMCVFGTRPEVIKLASFIFELQERGINHVLVNTGQHLDMTKQMLDVFNIKSTYNLKIMEHKQSLSKILKNVMNKLNPVVLKELPNLMVVVGDTTTTLGSALVAYYNKIPIVHIEGGPRTYNKYDSYPEEGNRRMIDHISDINTCQSFIDVQRLEKENIFNGKFVGNTSLDVLKLFIGTHETKNQILITMHRREDWDSKITGACEAIKELALNYNNYKFIISVHPNPIVCETIKNNLKDIENVVLLEALPFDVFSRYLAESKIIMTDSGGIVQEAMFLHKPIVYLREKCEYECLFDGEYLITVGKNKEKIINATKHLLNMDYIDYQRSMAFGNGNAGKRIADIIFGETNE